MVLERHTAKKRFTKSLIERTRILEKKERVYTRKLKDYPERVLIPPNDNVRQRPGQRVIPDVTKGRFETYPRDTDYFVSNTKNIGFEITPEEFLEKVKNNKLKENEVVRFFRNEIFDLGKLDFAVPGIKVDAYGAGADPKLRGTRDISTLVYSDLGGGLYSTPMAEEPNWVWIAGECAKNAETARIPVVSRGSTTTITVAHANVSAYSSIVGSYIVVKQQKWRNSYRRKVTAYNGAGLITVDGDIPVSGNIDLVLYNNTEYFSGNNEWAWESGTLYVKSEANPSTMTIRSNAYNYAVKDASSTTIRNIEFAEYYQFGVLSVDGVSVIENCNFHDIRDTGIFFQHQVTGAIIENNTISRIGNCGIVSRPLINASISDNVIDGIGMQASYGWQTWSDGNTSAQTTGTGILNGPIDTDDSLVSIDCTIERNLVSNTAYNGIANQGSTGHVIRYNTVSDFMGRFGDGSGIYTVQTRLYDVPQDGTEISYNIVYDANGATDGFGVYIDNRTKAAFVHHNTVYDCAGGVILNYDTTDHIVEDNIIHNCSVGAIFRQADITGQTELFTENINNQFNRNTISCARAEDRCVLFEIPQGSFPTWNPFSGTGGSDNNIYINPYGVNIADSDNKGNDLTLSELRTAYNADAASTEHTNYITEPGIPSQNLLLITNSTDAEVNGTAPEGYNNAAGVAVTNYTIPAHYGLLLVARANSAISIFFESASSQYVNLGTAADIQFERTDPFSISFWFKIPNNPAAGKNILTNFGGSNRGYTVNILTTGFIQIELRNTVTTNRYTNETTSDWADNTWHHFLFVKPATFSNAKLYIDGVDDSGGASNNLTGTIVNTDALFLAHRESLSTYFDGYIDELAIWASDQTANVANIFNGGLTHDLTELDAPPLHYWKLGDDGYVDSGSSATPLNGIAVNSPTISTDVP